MTYFVKLDEGRNIRRTILESSKSSIQILKDEQELLQLRERKKVLLSQARKEFKELNKLLGQLEKAMPQLTKKELDELRPKKVIVKKTTKTTKKAVKPEKKELTKLEKLEKSLHLIETRLNKL